VLNGLDLFSGIGGLTLALNPWVRPVAYCENDRFAQGVLLSRMSQGQLPRAPIWDDVRTLTGCLVGPNVDIIYGGFPCQDLSVAGAGAGLDGERSGLVSHVFRLARECRPRFLFLENVPALAVRGLDRLLLELHALGFDARWTIVSAAEMGAPHLRERIWILAHARSERIRVESKPEPGGSGTPEPILDGQKDPNTQSVGWIEGRPESEPSRRTQSDITRSILSDSCSEGRQRWLDAKEAWQAFALGGGGGGGGGGGVWPSWLPQPAICRGADGTAHRVDALRGLGNSVVPIAAREAFIRLSGVRRASEVNAVQPKENE
jgi:DNA (cytosine-5)-methyltransferase 1